MFYACAQRRGYTCKSDERRLIGKLKIFSRKARLSPLFGAGELKYRVRLF